MFFDRLKHLKQGSLRSWLVLLLLPVVLVACSLEVGEKPVQDKKIRVGDEGFSCMSHVAEKVSAYVDAELGKNEITEFIDCVGFSLTSFTKYTDVQGKDGKRQGQYSADELKAYIEKYFIKDRPISSELMQEVMAIKQVLVGGSQKSLTKTEILSLTEKLDVLKEEAIRLQPYMPLYNLKVGQSYMERGLTLPDLEEGIEALRISAQRLGEEVEKGQRPYTFQNMEEFLRTFREFVDWKKHFDHSESSKTWTDLMKAFKSLAVGPGRTDIEELREIAGTDWQELLQSASSWYSVLMLYQYKVAPHSVSHNPGLENLIELVHTGVDLTRQAVDAQNTGAIEYKRLEFLVDVIERLDLIPYEISGRSVKSILHPVFDRILGDTAQSTQSRTSPGLDRAVISRAEQEFVMWAHIQRYLDRSYDANQPLEQATAWANPSDFGWNQFFDVFGCANCSMDELKRIIKNMRPLFPHGQDRIFVAQRSKLEQNRVVHGFYNLSMMNAIRGAVRLLFRGYSKNPQRFEKMQGITEDEMQAFYLDFKKLGVEMQIMDPRNHAAGHRAFMEANLFTYLGDGLNEPDPADHTRHLLRFEEGSEFLAFAYSGGTLGDLLYKALRERCGHPSDPLDVLGAARIRRTCLQQYLLPYLTQSIPNMPGMKAFIEGLSEEDWGLFQKQLVDAVKRPDGDKKWVEKMEVTAFALVLHYIEAIMTKSYNETEPDILTGEEVWQAYSTYQGLIKKMAREAMCMKLDEEQTRDVYAFILKYGEIPEPSIFDQSTWDHFKGIEWGDIITRIRRGEDWNFVTDRLGSNARMLIGKHLGWDFRLDRMKLSRVFSAIIKSAAGEDKPACALPAGSLETGNMLWLEEGKDVEGR